MKQPVQKHPCFQAYLILNSKPILHYPLSFLKSRPMHAITDAEFQCFQALIQRTAGIHLAANKKALVSGRLARRLQLHRLDSYGAYYELLQRPGQPQELQACVDLLTTNETYFFREPRHFDWLRAQLPQLASAATAAAPWRVWSAACASGEEAYSLAMLLADVRPQGGWQVLGSDISQRMLARARIGHYPLARCSHIPPNYLQRFCLRGVGPEDGTLLVQRTLRDQVEFAFVNLHTPLPALPLFDAIFLRNVLIYFDAATKQAIVQRVLDQLRPGGHVFIGHSESLHGLEHGLEPVAPAVYRKP